MFLTKLSMFKRNRFLFININKMNALEKRKLKEVQRRVIDQLNKCTAKFEIERAKPVNEQNNLYRNLAQDQWLRMEEIRVLINEILENE